MAIFLERIDSVPLFGSDFTMEFSQWLSVLVDSLNQTLEDIQDDFNLLTAQSYTAAEITALQSGGELSDGVLLYDTTNTVYVGRISGSLVKFTTAAYP